MYTFLQLSNGIDGRSHILTLGETRENSVEMVDCLAFQNWIYFLLPDERDFDKLL